MHQSYVFTLLCFCSKMGGGHPSLLIQIDLPDNEYGAKDILSCVFTLSCFSESHCWILEYFQKSLFWCKLNHSFSKTSVLKVSFLDGTFKNLSLVEFLGGISVNTFTKMVLYLSVLCKKI